MVQPKPVVKIESAEGEIFWSYGKQFVSEKRDNIEAIVAYEKQRGTDLIFDVEIINNSSDTVLICPESFHYITDKLKSSDSIKKVFAYDPEVRLFNIDKALSVQHAEKINSNNTTFFEGALQFAVDVSPKTDEEREENRMRKEDREIRQDEAKEFAVSHINSLNGSRRYWANEVLRKTTLVPGYSVYGKVFIRRNIDAKKYLLNIPIGDKVYDFRYNQKVVYPE